jgi:hypothetical protein
MLAALTPEEYQVIRRSMEATFCFFDADFQTRLGIPPDTMRSLLLAWPNIDDSKDESDACLAINNTLNDLLNGVGISDAEALELVGVTRAEMQRVYGKWASARGWGATGVK